MTAHADQGYYRYPTISGDTIVFVAEDDLWAVPATGGVARRLTAGRGPVTRPRFTPDGSTLVFLGREEGQTDLYAMPAAGGPIRRLTFVGEVVAVAGFTPQGEVVYASTAKVPFRHPPELYAVPVHGGESRRLPWGPGLAVAFGPDGGVVLGRHTQDPARWKRYRGGTVGQIWIDRDGSGEFRRLAQPEGNLASPMWVGRRIFFLSDHEGVGNLYSVRPDGTDLRRHTDHDDFYARNASTDGRRVVYHAGGDLFLYDPETDGTTRVPVEFRSQRTARERRFVDASRFLEDYVPHPRGERLALVSRGQLFALAVKGGPVTHVPPGSGVRYRLARWADESGQSLVALDDRTGEERLVRIPLESGPVPEDPPVVAAADFGRARELAVALKTGRLALANHRFELFVVDLATGRAEKVVENRYGPPTGLAWSPDGRYLAYSAPESPHLRALYVLDAEAGAVHRITRPVLEDVAPAWDPDGRYLYFLGRRVFDPVYDNLTFDLGFPRGMRPYLVTLRADEPSPFVGAPDAADDASRGGAERQAESDGSAEPLRIDFDGIADRVLPFPVHEGRYGQIAGIPGKVLWTSFPVEGALERNVLTPAVPPANGTLEAWNLKERKLDTLAHGVTDFRLAPDHKTLVLRRGLTLRAVRAGEKVDDKPGDGPPPGTLDWHRVSLAVDPPREWAQMLREAWRLMREHFWTADMSGVDWEAVFRRYAPLLARITTRGELSDLIWEMQGELGTSHAYEMGGDYPPEPNHPRGSLAADFAYDAAEGAWRVTHVVRGDPGTEGADSPLRAPGVDVREGDCLLAVDGVAATADQPPEALLVNKREREVALVVRRPGGQPRTVTVRTLGSETQARYREWVEANRAFVHAASDGRVGYVHVPDMMARGFAEFHRSFLAEVDRPALIVDVRFNGGGHVSQLLLEKLARRRLGYDVPRWGVPIPYPADSPAGPLVAVTNELAGSDGDIFSHAFKLLGLGPLVGERTWGGVIGIEPQAALVDGTVTSQPEYSFWFKDVGWGVENYGTEPTIPVVYRPQDYAAGRDPQLERAVQEALALLAVQPPDSPPDEPRPRRAVGPLPPRR
jgi:tricorn protease